MIHPESRDELLAMAKLLGVWLHVGSEIVICRRANFDYTGSRAFSHLGHTEAFSVSKAKEIMIDVATRAAQQ